MPGAPPQVFVVSTRKIQERGYETLYQFATASDRSLFGRVVLRCPKQLQVTCPCRCPVHSGTVHEGAEVQSLQSSEASLESHSAAVSMRPRPVQSLLPRSTSLMPFPPNASARVISVSGNGSRW